MTQGTTPTFTLTLPDDSGIDLTQAAHVYFTMSQGSAIVEKSDSDLTVAALSVDVYLTQADTLRFQIYSDAKIQLNWTYSDGSRACSEIKTVPIGENLHRAVIS